MKARRTTTPCYIGTGVRWSWEVTERLWSLCTSVGPSLVARTGVEADPGFTHPPLLARFTELETRLIPTREGPFTGRSVLSIFAAR